MPPQTQPTQQPQALDPQAVNLAKSIRQTESGGNFQAKGKSGEHGAYQFMPATWDAYSKEAGVNVPLEQATPEQQNEVAYKKIKQWKDAGHNVGEIASMWNAGEGKPQAYLQNNVGTNDKGVSFDTPEYAKKVATEYQTLKGQPQGQSTTSQGQNPLGVSTAEASNGQHPQDQSNILEKLINFAFPIAGDIGAAVQGKTDKSFGQIAGDLGQSALWFAPGIGEGAEAAIKGAGLLGDAGAKVAGQTLGGAATGYASDVSSNLSQGKSLGNSLTPGVGTLTGGALGGVLGKVGNKLAPEEIAGKIADANNDALRATQTGARKLAKSAKGGNDTGSFLAGKGINLQQYVNPETLHYDTTPIVSNLQKEAGSLDDVLTEALDQSGGKTTLQDLESEALRLVNNKANQEEGTVAARQQQVKDEIEKYRAQYGDDISLGKLNGIKRGQRRISGIFDASKPHFSQDVNYQISNAAKKLIEDAAEKQGLSGVKEFNQYLGQHLDAIKALDPLKTGTLHGRAAKGGQLGKYFQQEGLTALGAGTGALFGGGPMGSILGGLIGHYGAKGIGNILRKAGASPLKSAMLRKAIQEDPEIVQKLQKFIGDKKTIAPFLKSSPKKTGMLAKAGLKGLITTGSRIGSQFNK